MKRHRKLNKFSLQIIWSIRSVALILIYTSWRSELCSYCSDLYSIHAILYIMLILKGVRTDNRRWLLPILKSDWQWVMIRCSHRHLLCKHLSNQQTRPRRILKIPFTGAPFSEEPQNVSKENFAACFRIRVITSNSNLPILPLQARTTRMCVMDLFTCMQASILTNKMYLWGGSQ